MFSSSMTGCMALDQNLRPPPNGLVLPGRDVVDDSVEVIPVTKGMQSLTKYALLLPIVPAGLAGHR